MKKSCLIPAVFIGLVILFAASCLIFTGQAFLIPWLNARSEAGLSPTEPLPEFATPTVQTGSIGSQATQPPATPTAPTTEPFPKSTQAAATELVSPQTSISAAEETLSTLIGITVPASDLFDLAYRLEGKSNIAPTLEPPLFPFQVGAQKAFWVLDTDANQYFQVQTILQYATEHLYFWVETGTPYNENALHRLAETFENHIYPTTRAFFGSEWTPGVDSDPHLYVVLAGNVGNSVAGYFSSNDEYPPLLSEYSNGHEMFLINADQVALDQEYTYGVLAHEFQHMIHWNLDINEDIWMNEGFADLAMLLNGYDIGGADLSYAADPDIQLNYWPDEQEELTPHYGAAFLFLAYFLDRFGEQTTQRLVAHAENGLTSIDQVLAEMNLADPETGQVITAEDLFADWVIATYLQDGGVGDGRYAYSNYPSLPDPEIAEVVRSCPNGVARREVSQFGVDYVLVRCRGDILLEFAGTEEVALLPTDPYSGDYAFWSNRGDEADMSLTRAFDFRNVPAPISMTYWTWYDLEQDYDFLYLEASLDGERWQILTTPAGTPEDPKGNSFGWAYNGASGGGNTPRWIQENVDLSQFAGQLVNLRFEYVTDSAVNGEGQLLDDIAVPQIGYFSDFEADSGGWKASGFARVQNVLPQTYRISLIKSGENTTVEKFVLSGENTLQIPLRLGDGVNEVILVVSGTTRYTNQKASYQYSLEER